MRSVNRHHDQLHVMLDQQDGDTAVADLPDAVVEVADLFRVHAGRRLVEQ